jgi:uncharacterized RDD family membrane protein YckC
MSDTANRNAGKALASRWRRLVATLIDMVLVPAVTVFAVLITGVTEHAEDYQNPGAMTLSVLGLAIASYLIVNGYLLWRRGQTVGKAILNIAIVSAATMEKAPLWKLVCVRALFFPTLFLIPVPPYTLIPLLDQAAVFLNYRRCIHDYIAGTIVVDAS